MTVGGRLEIVDGGPLTTVQDLGRPGHAAIGIGGAGAADRGSHSLANRLVGNPAGAATLEVLLGGLTFTACSPISFAVTGAELDVLAGPDCKPLGHNTRHHVPAGTEIELGQARTGLRCYVAVRGGIDCADVLGSRSRDTLADIGPAPLQAGDLLDIGTDVLPLPVTDFVPAARVGAQQAPLRVLRGPRDDWLADADGLIATTWQVSDRASRVGVRLVAQRGPGVAMRDPGRQLPSEGAGLGAIQVPPGGEPVIFLADHPVTGGYPVAGVLVDEDVDRAAQLRPGTEVRLTWA
ncbi:biotin-dependent carboxyltransferase family protein [Mycolicibacterium iranicum]|uniref:Allophanate hydrolase n=1 Tax=Mycolicibacterium iranicum TaxID=912594 RepID=A0A178LJQ0_MYCIR|nr:biotin-dependent carboxyltransferase family protein [Mycolicibacterium iranicum]OAN30167.1 allophanate hydrolase [Mycolicibacterium iranicum]